MSPLTIPLLLLIAPPAPPARPAWDIAGCRKARSVAEAPGGHECSTPHLDRDWGLVNALLKDELQGEWRDFLRFLVERGGVETGAALFSLGDLYYSGRGLPRDPAQAAAFYRRAADMGLAGAQFNLGLMYASGEGVLQDYTLAYMWLNLAASRAASDAQGLYVTARERIGRLMTPGQMADAQVRSREWAAAFERRAASPSR